MRTAAYEKWQSDCEACGTPSHICALHNADKSKCGHLAHYDPNTENAAGETCIDIGTPVVVAPDGSQQSLTDWARDGTPADPDPPRARAGQLLADAAQTVGAGGDRHRDYGSAIDNFTDIGRLWAVVLGLDEITPEQVALCMNQVKVARLKHSPNHRDSWVDGAGYLALGGDIAGTPGRYL